MKKISARQLTTAAAIAALYTVLSLASSFIPTVGGVFQFRVSEALTILPYFTPAAIPGLFIGCLLSNLITGALPYDLVFGSLATLIGAIGTFALRKLGKNTSRTLPGGMPLGAWLAPLPPIAANTIIMPFVIAKISVRVLRLRRRNCVLRRTRAAAACRIEETPAAVRARMNGSPTHADCAASFKYILHYLQKKLASNAYSGV